jgi:hypothetical protein
VHEKEPGGGLFADLLGLRSNPDLVRVGVRLKLQVSEVARELDINRAGFDLCPDLRALEEKTAARTPDLQTNLQIGSRFGGVDLHTDAERAVRRHRQWSHVDCHAFGLRAQGYGYRRRRRDDSGVRQSDTGEQTGGEDDGEACTVQKIRAE